METYWLKGYHCRILYGGDGLMGNLRFLDVRGGDSGLLYGEGKDLGLYWGSFIPPIIDSPELPQMSKKGLSLGTHATDPGHTYRQIYRHQ